MKPAITLQNLGSELKRKRGDRGIREVAKEIGISSATLSRIENGKLPDLDTFSRACRWLDVDGGKILGCAKKENQHSPQTPQTSFHLKADKNLSTNTARALADMILTAQKMFSNV